MNYLNFWKTKKEEQALAAPSSEVVAAIALALSSEAAGATAPVVAATAGQPSELAAAIAMALYESSEWHDIESNVLTIHKVQNFYSPWNSKIYSLRETPLRR